jgi:hypothetical protein
MDSLFALRRFGGVLARGLAGLGPLWIALACVFLSVAQGRADDVPPAPAATTPAVPAPAVPAPAVSAPAAASASTPPGSSPASEPASPETDAARTARARELFQTGNRLADGGDFPGAAASYREALALREAPAVEYNLAAALSELHEYDESYNRTQSVLVHPDTPPAVQERAKKLEASLRARVARLTVVTNGTESSLDVQVDGKPLDPKLIGRAQAVPPGIHEIVASRDGSPISSRSVEIPVSTAALVDVSLIVTERDGPAAEMKVSTSSEAGTPDAPGQDHKDTDPRRKRRLWLGVAAAVVAVGVGVGVGIALAGNKETRQEPLQGDTGVLTW